MKQINLSNVQPAGEFKRVTPGGYVCRIYSVEDVPEKEYLKLEYDIVEGEFKNHYKDLFDNNGFWGGSFIKSYKENALPYWKTFIEAIKSTNKGFVWHDLKPNDEGTLLNKGIGLVLGEEEYKSNTGETKTRLYVASIKTAEGIRKGDFTVPQLKKLGEGAMTRAYNNSSSLKPLPENEELPF